MVSFIFSYRKPRISRIFAYLGWNFEYNRSKSLHFTAHKSDFRVTRIHLSVHLDPTYARFTVVRNLITFFQFIDIISSATRAHSKSVSEEQPVVIKEGYLHKRAQGKKRFGLKNFKRRYFILTNQQLAYKREKGKQPIGVSLFRNVRSINLVFLKRREWEILR